MMLNEQSIVDRIELARSRQPFCGCGRHTVTTYRDGAVWLDCAIVNEPLYGRAKQLWMAITDGQHIHRLIVDVPEPDQQAA